MTLLIGIKCEAGIVVGADGAATFGNALGLETIVQATPKLEIIGERVVLGVAGPVGLGQSYHREIDEYISRKLDRKTTWKNITEARNWLRENMWKHAQPAWEHAAVVARSIGQAAAQSANSETLMAFAVDDEPYLLQFNHQCQPEEATDKLPFVALGSGQSVADPFLAFIRRVFWPEGAPSLDDGMLAAVWTLEHAITSMQRGVAGPYELVTLSKNDGKVWRAKKYLQDDLGQQSEHVQALQADMRKLKDDYFKARTKSTIPKPP